MKGLMKVVFGVVLVGGYVLLQMDVAFDAAEAARYAAYWGERKEGGEQLARFWPGSRLSPE